MNRLYEKSQNRYSNSLILFALFLEHAVPINMIFRSRYVQYWFQFNHWVLQCKLRNLSFAESYLSGSQICGSSLLCQLVCRYEETVFYSYPSSPQYGSTSWTRSTVKWLIRSLKSSTVLAIFCVIAFFQGTYSNIMFLGSSADWVGRFLVDIAVGSNIPFGLWPWCQCPWFSTKTRWHKGADQGGILLVEQCGRIESFMKYNLSANVSCKITESSTRIWRMAAGGGMQSRLTPCRDASRRAQSRRKANRPFLRNMVSSLMRNH